MLAMTYRGPYRVRVVEKPMPEIEHPRDNAAGFATKVTIAVVGTAALVTYLRRRGAR